MPMGMPYPKGAMSTKKSKSSKAEKEYEKNSPFTKKQSAMSKAMGVKQKKAC